MSITVKEILTFTIPGILLFFGIPSIAYSLFHLSRYSIIFPELDPVAEFLYIWLFVGLILTITGIVLLFKYKLAWAFYR